MNLLVTTSSFPGTIQLSKKKFGGAPFLLDDCSVFQKMGYTLDVLTPFKEGMSEFEIINGINIYRFKYPLMKSNPGYYSRPTYSKKNFLSLLSNLSMALWLSLNVYKIIRKNQYHFIWANWLQVAFFSKLGALRHNKVISTIRGSDIRNSNSLVIRMMVMLVPDLFNMFTVDNEICHWVKKYNFNEYSVPRAYQARRICKVKRKKKIVVIGRLDGIDFDARVKGLGENTFFALRDAMQLNKELSLTVIGTGVKEVYFSSLFEKYENRVNFIGWLEDFTSLLNDAFLVIGGAGVNGVITDAVPYGIAPLISMEMKSELWEDKKNCLVYDYQSIDSIKKCILFALDNPEKMEQIIQQSKKTLVKYALPVDSAMPIWRDKINEFIKK